MQYKIAKYENLEEKYELAFKKAFNSFKYKVRDNFD